MCHKFGPTGELNGNIFMTTGAQNISELFVDYKDNVIRRKKLKCLLILCYRSLQMPFRYDILRVGTTVLHNTYTAHVLLLIINTSFKIAPSGGREIVSHRV